MTEQVEKYQGFWIPPGADFQRARGNITGTVPLRTLAQARKDAEAAGENVAIMPSNRGIEQ